MSALLARRDALPRNRSAVAGLEFALIAPTLIIFFMATVELANFFRMQAKVNTAAGQLAELVARQTSVTAPGGSLADLCTGAAMNITPYDTTVFAADIASVSNDHPSNRVSGSTDSTSVVNYLDWENVSSCSMSSPSTMGSSGAFTLANTPASLLTQSGSPAANAASGLAYAYSAIVVRATYTYSNVLTFTLGQSITTTAIAVARPRTNVTIKCTNPAGTAACPQLQ